MIQLKKTWAAHLKLNVNVAACFNVWFNCSRFDCWFNRLSCCFHSLWSEMIFALSFFWVLKSEIKNVENGFRFEMCLKSAKDSVGSQNEQLTQQLVFWPCVHFLSKFFRLLRQSKIDPLLLFHFCGLIRFKVSTWNEIWVISYNLISRTFFQSTQSYRYEVLSNYQLS